MSGPMTPTHETRERGDRPTGSGRDGTGAVRACRYCLAYRGRCGAPADGSGFCSGHSAIRCGVCGGQAVAECSHTGQFVCGAPLCDGCEGFIDEDGPHGAWGLANHGHRRKAPACEAVPAGCAAPDTPVAYLACPFCGEDDFDLLGLKTHLLRGWCEPFDSLRDAPPLTTGEDEAIPDHPPTSTEQMR